MSRMIDADALAKAMGVYTYMKTEWTPATAWGVPIVDAEPVVRCKDCWYYATGWCRKWLEWSDDNNGFCSWGERREDGEVD